VAQVLKRISVSASLNDTVATADYIQGFNLSLLIEDQNVFLKS